MALKGPAKDESFLLLFLFLFIYLFFFFCFNRPKPIMNQGSYRIQSSPWNSFYEFVRVVYASCMPRGI